MRDMVRLILMGGLIGVSGCACHRPLGEVIDDPARRAALLQGYRRPQVRKQVFRTLIRWPGRELSLVEIVKALPEGGFSVAGVTDIGTTLYAARIDPNGTGRVVDKSLPFSDRWVLEGLVAELLLPWNGPHQGGELYALSDGGWALVYEEGRITGVFLFNQAGRWREFHRLSGCRLRAQTSLEWADGTVPTVMRVDNVEKHYHAVRESISSD